jgi:hypothetical protein
MQRLREHGGQLHESVPEHGLLGAQERRVAGPGGHLPVLLPPHPSAGQGEPADCPAKLRARRLSSLPTREPGLHAGQRAVIDAVRLLAGEGEVPPHDQVRAPIDLSLAKGGRGGGAFRRHWPASHQGEEAASTVLFLVEPIAGPGEYLCKLLLLQFVRYLKAEEGTGQQLRKTQPAHPQSYRLLCLRVQGLPGAGEAEVSVIKVSMCFINGRMPGI